MSANEAALLDPFAVSAPDEAAELSALVRTLELAEGFQLIFARCNQIPQRERLMEEVRSRLPKLNIQTIFFREPIQHLLDSMQVQLTMPLPDIIFVSGLEFSLPVAAEAHVAPLIANINASRNSFAQLLSCSVVFWVPEYVLTAIAQGAPDFFSVRSSVYFFAVKPAEIDNSLQNLSTTTFWEVESLSWQEKQDRTAAIEQLLADYEFLPDQQRDLLIELRLIEQLAALYYAQGKYGEAMKLYERGLPKFGQLGLRGGVARTLHQMGMMAQAQGEYSKAMELYEKSLQMAKELGVDRVIADTLHQMGTVAQEQGKYSEAMKFYEQSLQRFADLGHKRGLASTLQNMGVMAQRQGEHREAMKFYEQSLQLTEQLEDKRGIADILHQMGMMTQAQGKYSEAMKFYEQSLQLTEQLGDKRGIASTLGQLGTLARAQGQMRDALKYLLQARTIFEDLQSPYHQLVLQDLANVRAIIESNQFGAWLRELSPEPQRILSLINAINNSGV